MFSYPEWDIEPLILLQLSISTFRFVNIGFIYLDAPILGTYVFEIFILLMNCLLYRYVMTSFVSCDNYLLKEYLI